MKIIHAKEFLHLIEAAAQGKTIQFLPMGRHPIMGWFDLSPHETIDDTHVPQRYRIKPEPKLLAWTQEEVPVGAQLKTISTLYLILAASKLGIRVADFEKLHTYPFDYVLSEGYTHSTDGGKTWLPCGILE